MSGFTTPEPPVKEKLFSPLEVSIDPATEQLQTPPSWHDTNREPGSEAVAQSKVVPPEAVKEEASDQAVQQQKETASATSPADMVEVAEAPLDVEEKPKDTTDVIAEAEKMEASQTDLDEVMEPISETALEQTEASNGKQQAADDRETKDTGETNHAEEKIESPRANEAVPSTSAPAVSSLTNDEAAPTERREPPSTLEQPTETNIASASTTIPALSTEASTDQSAGANSALTSSEAVAESISPPHAALPGEAVQQDYPKPLTTTDTHTQPTSGAFESSMLAPATSTSQAAASNPAPASTSASASGPSTSIPVEKLPSDTPRLSTSQQLMEAQGKARQDEIMRLQKENEDMRLMWLSLPANDHITYYSDTEEDASSSASDVNGVAPIGAYGGLPFLSGIKSSFGNGKRKRETWMQEEERESSDSEDENAEKEEISEERRFRTGNRGNKLQKRSRWIRRGKLGLWTEAKNEKEMHDRFTSRVKAVQRAGVESLLYNAPGPKVIQDGGARTRDILAGSDRMLLKDINSTGLTEENLNSTSLAPALLRPILSARALLESHTLRHTFRNPHIGALSKTALDLRESEGQLSRALGRCFGAMEKINAFQEIREERGDSSESKYGEIDNQAIGVDGTDCTSDELNPAFAQLDQLFVTKKGLPIPSLAAAAAEEGQQQQPPNEVQAVLSVAQQRDVVRAALECLYELGADSLEYVERLDEVRGRLEAVKRRRTQVWEALRLWAIKRECGPDEDEEGGEVEEDEGLEDAAGIRIGAKPTAVTAVAAGPSRKRR